MTLEQWHQQAQYFDYSRGDTQHRIAYWTQGPADAPPLLLIHGFPTASWDWQALWPQLCEHYRVLAIDMMGFGYSAKPRGYAYSILDQADLITQLATSLGMQQCHVLAHDYGDTVAQELLARHLENQQQAQNSTLRLKSVCLLNGGLFPETHRATFAQKMLNSVLGPVVARLMSETRFNRSFCHVFGPHTQPSAAELKDFWSLMSAEQGSQGIAHLLIRYIGERRQHRERWVGALQKAGEPSAEQSGVPLRVICGAVDPVSGAHMAQRYRELVAAPDVVLLPDIGHYPQCEAPQQVLESFLAFQAGLAEA